MVSSIIPDPRVPASAYPRPAHRQVGRRFPVLDWAIGGLQALVILFFLFPTLAVYAQIPADEDADTAATEDHRHEFPPTRNPKHGTRVVPHLGQLRSTYLQKRGFEA